MPVKTFSINEHSEATIFKALEQDGCVILVDCLLRDEFASLKKSLRAKLVEQPMCAGNFFGFLTKRLSRLFSISKTAEAMAVHKTILAVMDHFLLKNCEQYQLNLTQVIEIHPGEPAQFIHTDDLMFPFQLTTRGEQKMINCMWAIDDFTDTNGATVLVPGSHIWPIDRTPTEAEKVKGVMSAGSVLIYFGSLLHGGGANNSDAARLGVVISYCLGWLRQAENQYLAVDSAIASSMSERMQRLLGYFVHKPNLGAVDGRDPIEVLHSMKAGEASFEEFIAPEVQEMLGEHRKEALREVSRR